METVDVPQKDGHIPWVFDLYAEQFSHRERTRETRYETTEYTRVLYGHRLPLDRAWRSYKYTAAKVSQQHGYMEVSSRERVR